MAPVTRASVAPVTPQKTFSRTASATPEARSRPRCQICMKLRKGHPRTGCPYGSPQTDDNSIVDTSLASALSSLRISPEAEIAPATPAATTSSVPEDMSSIAKIRRERRRLMPCTLFPYASDNRTSESPSPPSTPSVESWNPDKCAEDPGLSEPSSLARRPSTHSSRPIVRSASENARESFLDELERVASHVPVSVYMVATTDVEQLQSSAKDLGFHTAAVVPEDRTQKDEVPLVIGTDYAAVGDVRDRLVKEDVTTVKRNGEYGLAHIAGGVMVGAAAIFTSLLM
ncbi:unnamed protein product [Peniophora sp. CBMAI 1063]|nr:unnamed protein product [Peniophora sp. CBMAI 1063]